MPSLIGTGQDQVPTNGLLGSMAFVDAEAATFQLAGNGTENLDPVTLQQLNTEKYGRLLDVKVLTGSGVYTPTTGTKSVLVELVGGGGGASALPACTSSQIGVSLAGQTGGYIKAYLKSNFSGASYSVGEGGAGGTTGNGLVGSGTLFQSSSPGSVYLLAAGGNRGIYAAPYANNISATIAPVSDLHETSIASGTILGVDGLVLERLNSYPVEPFFINLSGHTGVSPSPQGKMNSKCVLKYFSTGGLQIPPSSFGPGAGGKGGTSLNITTTLQAGSAGTAGTIIIYEYA